MRQITLQEVLSALNDIKLPSCQLVVGIAQSGVAPAALVAAKIGRDLKIVRLKYRNAKNLPQYAEPRLLSKITLAKNIKSILLVDDAAISGKTLQAAKKIFNGCKIKTLVLRGQADYVLFPKLNNCVQWPWRA